MKFHGNSHKNDGPYYRIEGSVLEKIKNDSLFEKSASLKYNSLIKNNTKGTLSRLPRSVNQFYYHKCQQLKVKNENKKTCDEILDSLIKRKKGNFFKIFIYKIIIGLF